MNYRLRIHSVDLQDHDGFLDFLQNQAREGYEAVRVFRTCTLFRKTEAPPQEYSLRFVPEGQGDRDPGRTIRTARSGVRLTPGREDSAREELAWERDLTEHYNQFAPTTVSDLIHRGELTVVVPIALVVLTAVRLRISQAELDHLVTLGVVLFCAALFGFCAEGLALAAERFHLR